MSDLIIKKKDETYILLEGEPSVLLDLSDAFSFYADGYRFNPKVRAKLWSGKIMLLRRTSQTRGQIYYGLLHEILKICKSRNYTVEIHDDLKIKNKPSKEELEEYIHGLNLSAKGEKITARDYQVKAFVDVIQLKRQLTKAPTSAGKSAIIYSICRYLNDKDLKGLLIVPNLSLINQMYGDFIDYSSLNGWSTEDNVHQIYSGKEKTSDKNILLATWQSLATIGKYNNNNSNNSKKDNELSANDYFKQFDYVIVDEAHSLRAVEIGRILESCTNASYRIGLTGTTSKTKANINTIIGLTGPVNDLITTRELIERKEVANFDIKCLVLKYDKETASQLRTYRYQDEVKYIISNRKRNTFIKNLALSMKSNSLVLFNFIEHGKLLHKMISESKFIGDRNVYLIYGGIDGEERERIRHIIETEKNAIIIASVQTTGTGVSIKNLHNIIFCLGTKSSIRVLQSIGRAIRLHNDKEKATIYDIVDDLSIRKHQNFAVKHFLERVKIYNEQQFSYKLKNIDFPQN